MHTGGKTANIVSHLNALWYFLRNGCAWRGLPCLFGKWATVHQYFNRLSKDGYFEFLQDQLICVHTPEAVFMDSTHCKVHQHSNGSGSPEDQAIGKSRGGLNTKVHMVVDVLGRLAAAMVLTPGNVSDITTAPELVSGRKPLESRPHKAWLGFWLGECFQDRPPGWAFFCGKSLFQAGSRSTFPL